MSDGDPPNKLALYEELPTSMLEVTRDASRGKTLGSAASRGAQPSLPSPNKACVPRCHSSHERQS